MDEKCWFVLRQHMYPPPDMPPPEEKKGWTGAICPGHIIRSPERLDNVENRSGLRPYPPNVGPYPSYTWNLTTHSNRERHAEGSFKGEAPAGSIPAALSVDVATVFRATVKNHAKFERVETFIIQPTEEYEADVLKDPEVQRALKRMRQLRLGVNAWTLYMISGIAIARGASGSREETRKREGSGEFGAEAPGNVGARFRTAAGATDTAEMSWEKQSDFVWAVRLHEISKNAVLPYFTDKVYTRGATFGQREEEAEEAKEISKDVFLLELGLDKKSTALYRVVGNDQYFIVQGNSQKTWGPYMVLTFFGFLAVLILWRIMPFLRLNS